MHFFKFLTGESLNFTVKMFDLTLPQSNIFFITLENSNVVLFQHKSKVKYNLLKNTSIGNTSAKCDISSAAAYHVFNRYHKNSKHISFKLLKQH